MWFWWFLFVCNLVIPISMIAGGRMMQSHCPKEINGMLGYRTRRSMRNQDTWRFANDYCGRLWQKIGRRMLFLSVLGQIPFWGSSEKAISVEGGVVCMVQCTIMLGSIFFVEKALKRTFFEDGSRRQSLV